MEVCKFAHFCEFMENPGSYTITCTTYFNNWLIEHEIELLQLYGIVSRRVILRATFSEWVSFVFVTSYHPNTLRDTREIYERDVYESPDV
jgi:hypothetical protein